MGKTMAVNIIAGKKRHTFEQPQPVAAPAAVKQEPVVVSDKVEIKQEL